MLHLATVHVDAAGRDVRAEFRDRDVHEADALFEKLVVQSRTARRAVSRHGHAVHGPPGVVAPVNGAAVDALPVDGDGAALLSVTGQPLPPPAVR